MHAIVSVATLATFARAVPYPLQHGWDDGRFITDNPLVREPSLEALIAIFSEVHLEAYHPLHLLSYWLDVPWFGASGPVVHATSLLLWIVAANVVLAGMRALGLALGFAVLATLACMLHPVQVEAVAWGAGRKDALALLFASAAILMHVRSQRFGDRAAWLSRGAFVCAALSKTSVLPLPAVLWLYDVLLRRTSLKRATLAQLPSFALAAALTPVVISTWQSNQMIRGVQIGSAPSRFVATIAHLLGTALWPSSTSPMYSTRAFAHPSAGAWLLVAVLLGVLVYAARKHAWRAGFALLAFITLALPVCNIVPMVFPWQDRYLSLPLWALAFGFGAALSALAKPPRNRAPSAAATTAPSVIGALLVAALCLRTVQYQGMWRSELRLWTHAASTQPDAFYSWMKLGQVRREHDDLEGAIAAYEQLVALEPTFKLGHSARFLAVALKDERDNGIAPSRAEAFARQFHGALDDAAALRALSGRLLTAGYLQTLKLSLGRALDIEPFPDEVLESAALARLKAGQSGVARFYVDRMKEPPKDPRLGLLRDPSRR
jgi:hypothetical protein